MPGHTLNAESTRAIRLAEFRIGRTQAGVAFHRAGLSHRSPAMPVPASLPFPSRLLSRGATAWFIAATLGQWAFVAFIVLSPSGVG